MVASTCPPAFLVSGLNLRFPVTNARERSSTALCRALSCGCPCSPHPGGSQLTALLWPTRPQTRIRTAWGAAGSGDGAVQVLLPPGGCCFQAIGQAGPCVRTLGLRRLVTGLHHSSLGSRPSSWLRSLVFHHHRTRHKHLSQAPPSVGGQGRIQAGRIGIFQFLPLP